MVDSKGNENEGKSNAEGVDDSEEENEILEESPCGRWLKRREEVEQKDIPGIDATYLAMDTEEGVEVVWNEVRFSERRNFKKNEETISEVFDRLIQLEHPNIVKLHKYWIHEDVDKPRVIFITEYMSSGSLKQFLKKTKRSLIRMALLGWRRWCTQTLSALCYLHTSQPPIVHGNLNCDTIFISHNGLIKIGAVAPDAIHKHVKTVRGDSKANLHFVAPEIGCITDNDSTALSPAVDIYSFGMCALEMAALEISANGETTHITDEVINNTIESLDNPLQKDFISRCLNKNSKERPTARELLFHPIIFEVPTLRLFAAHVIVNTPSYQPEQLTEEAIARFLCLQNSSDKVLAEIRHSDNRPPITIKQSDAPKIEFEKFFEEVRNGAFPLTAIVTTTRPPLISRQRTMSPEVSGESAKQLNSPENPYDEETRRIIHINCNIKPLQEANPSDTRIVIFILLRLDDDVNRKLTCQIIRTDCIPESLAQELVYYGLIHKDDREMVASILLETLNLSAGAPNQSASCQKNREVPQQQQIQQQLQPQYQIQHQQIQQQPQQIQQQPQQIQQQPQQIQQQPQQIQQQPQQIQQQPQQIQQQPQQIQQQPQQIQQQPQQIQQQLPQIQQPQQIQQQPQQIQQQSQQIQQQPQQIQQQLPQIQQPQQIQQISQQQPQQQMQPQQQSVATIEKPTPSAT